LRSFQAQSSEFNKRDIRVAAVSVDSVETNQKLSRKQGFAFPLLSDPKAEVVRRYDLLHAGAGPEGHDIARPAEFLIDSSGTVRWVNLTEDFRVRARGEQALKVVEQLGLGARP
jgi:peroxiredoxin